MDIKLNVNNIFAQARKILRDGDFSEASIKKACDKISKFATNLEQQLTKKGLLKDQNDTDELSLYASTNGVAVGTDTLTDCSLKAALVDRPNVTIGLATATSISVAEDGAQLVSSANFTAIAGADFVVSKTYNSSGTNWQASTEMVFAVDFKFLNDLNILDDKQFNKVTNSTMDLGSGNVAQASFDVFAQAEHTSVDVMADVLAIEDTLSSSFISANLYIA